MVKIFQPKAVLSYRKLLDGDLKKALITDLRKCEEILMYRQDVTNYTKIKYFLHFEEKIKTIVEFINGESSGPSNVRTGKDRFKLPKKVTTKESFQEFRSRGV